uniref:Neural proliferation, differentiation and control 1 n=1 Tax=Gopherus evgoodei TaxID=1825980 RepID=A0A8C4Y3S5_9SAUR
MCLTHKTARCSIDPCWLKESCPRSLDCTLQRREFCPPGSRACGPCLLQFVEDEHGRCVQRKWSSTGMCVRSSNGPSCRLRVTLSLHSALTPDCKILQLRRWIGLILGPKEIRLAQKTDYPAQKLPGPLPYDKISPGDQKLAQSAQMYHYQHQKQQMLSMEKHKEEPKLPDSASSDEENEDGDFTVYECPGLAPNSQLVLCNETFLKWPSCKISSLRFPSYLSPPDVPQHRRGFSLS